MLEWLGCGRRMAAGLGFLSPLKPSIGAFASLFLGFLVGGYWGAGRVQARYNVAPPEPTQMPVSDRLAEPVLPDSPTQVDIGRNLYYFHCMPCHGDRGQGLTDEWRQVWVEDHQNCWSSKCHTGRLERGGFYIPRFVPPVSGLPQALSRFQTAEDLFVYIRETQPPQRAGALSDSEYWALTAFLLHENDRLSPDAEIGPGIAGRSVSSSDVILATLVPLLAMFSVLWLGKRWRRTAGSNAEKEGGDFQRRIVL